MSSNRSRHLLLVEDPHADKSQPSSTQLLFGELVARRGAPAAQWCDVACCCCDGKGLSLALCSRTARNWGYYLELKVSSRMSCCFFKPNYCYYYSYSCDGLSTFRWCTHSRPLWPWLRKKRVLKMDEWMDGSWLWLLDCLTNLIIKVWPPLIQPVHLYKIGMCWSWILTTQINNNISLKKNKCSAYEKCSTTGIANGALCCNFQFTCKHKNDNKNTF